MDVPATRPVTATVTPAQPERQAVSAADAPVEPKPEAAPPPARESTDELLHTREAIAEQVSRFLQSSTRNLEFHVDVESGEAIIVVRDADGRVIRRIPGEEVLQIAHRLNAHSGTLIDSLA